MKEYLLGPYKDGNFVSNFTRIVNKKNPFIRIELRNKELWAICEEPANDGWLPIVFGIYIACVELLRGN